MFTINRAFTPGMQRFPAVTWTGDMQDCSHAKALDFAMWGQPWFTCDLTSPTATVLLRQYQGAVWWPIMRVHQMHGVPRMPFLWGGAAHQSAFRAALETRYALIPTLYSLAHAQSRPPFPPMVHPASFDFPGGGSPGLETTYMIGRSFIAADLSTTHSASDKGENASVAVLPAGPPCWFLFNSTTCVPGGVTVRRDDLALDEFPVYVRAGSLAPLQPWSTAVQHSAAQGGELEMQVYAGADASFDMVEDDGASNDYKGTAAAAATRTTRWAWSDADKTLSWSVVAGAKPPGAFPNDFTSVRVSLFAANATAVARYGAHALDGTSGTIHCSAL